MPRPHTTCLIVDYYETFLRDQDLGTFRANVSSRYTEGTLSRLLQADDVQSRRAAVLALGLIGSYQCNEALARALRDHDPAVRELAQGALWAIWFRADAPENNAMLLQVRELNDRRRFAEAEALATRLIQRAPLFAEAYNQRAIALFSQERFAESAADCRRTLELNPYHFGALSGLGQCDLRLGRRQEALRTFRRALKIQPYSEGLRAMIATLEAEGD
ncbi:MAG: tetratricopeptide repeat protein [Isosphaeraceae bacterium]|nr:tetratricopeptide repeat protein [Isosphaeraceae bacterium]